MWDYVGLFYQLGRKSDNTIPYDCSNTSYVVHTQLIRLKGQKSYCDHTMSSLTKTVTSQGEIIIQLNWLSYRMLATNIAVIQILAN